MYCKIHVVLVVCVMWGRLEMVDGEWRWWLGGGGMVDGWKVDNLWKRWMGGGRMADGWRVNNL